MPIFRVRPCFAKKITIVACVRGRGARRRNSVSGVNSMKNGYTRAGLRSMAFCYHGLTEGHGGRKAGSEER